MRIMPRNVNFVRSSQVDQRLAAFEEMLVHPNNSESLFNGSDLTGWRDGGANFFTHQAPNGGESYLVASKQQEKGSALKTINNYQNFAMGTDVWLDRGTDGGIYVRGSDDQLVYQIRLDYRNGNDCVGGILSQYLKNNYGDFVGTLRGMPKDASGKGVFKPNAWNRMVLLVNHDTITVWLNGVMVNEFTPQPGNKGEFSRQEPGFIGLQVHDGDYWESGKHQKFKNMRVVGLFPPIPRASE